MTVLMLNMELIFLVHFGVAMDVIVLEQQTVIRVKKEKINVVHLVYVIEDYLQIQNQRLKDHI